MSIDTKNPRFPAPAPDTALWRYSNLPKLLSLLTSKKLYLPSLRSLQREDPFEGYPLIRARRLARQLSQDSDFADRFFHQLYPTQPTVTDSAFRRQFISLLNGKAFELHDTCFVSCWHGRQHESAALWRLYSQEYGVAIRSSVKKLAENILAKGNAILGSVRYTDYESGDIDLTNALVPVFTKQISYEHEHEVRLLVELNNTDKTKSGILLDCEPQLLIEEIVVSPYAEQWIANIISDVTFRLGFEKISIRKSKLLNTDID